MVACRLPISTLLDRHSNARLEAVLRKLQRRKAKEATRQNAQKAELVRDIRIARSHEERRKLFLRKRRIHHPSETPGNSHIYNAFRAEMDAMYFANSRIYTHAEGCVEAMVSSLTKIKEYLQAVPEFVHSVDVNKMQCFLSYQIFPEIQLTTLQIFELLVSPSHLLWLSTVGPIMQMLRSSACHLSVREKALHVLEIMANSSLEARSALFAKGVMASICLLINENFLDSENVRLLRRATGCMGCLCRGVASSSRAYLRDILNSINIVLAAHPEDAVLALNISQVLILLVSKSTPYPSY